MHYHMLETACSEVDTLRSSLAALQAKLDEADRKLNALRLVCGTTDANKFETALDRANQKLDEAQKEVEKSAKAYFEVNLDRHETQKREVVMRESLGYIRTGLAQLGCPRVVDGVTGMNLRQQSMWSDALKLIDRALAASPECLKGKVLVERGAIEKGESICREADETNMRLEADLASARHDVEQLRAGTAWRSMETAPIMVGVLVVLDTGGVEVHHQRSDGIWSCYEDSSRPTAWQPLPSAPERSAAHGEGLEGKG